MPLDTMPPAVTHALILAAGRGERMRPLTDNCPKPLLDVRGKPLIVWQLEKLARAGIKHVVINTAWLEDQFPARLGDGRAWGLSIRYSHEGAQFGCALETAGGMATALPVLGLDRQTPCWLMPNPEHNPRGDFGLSPEGLALDRASAQFTYSTVGLYRPALLDGLAIGQKAALAPLLRQAMQLGRVHASLYSGAWTDVGTPERLAALNQTPVPRQPAN